MEFFGEVDEARAAGSAADAPHPEMGPENAAHVALLNTPGTPSEAQEEAEGARDETTAGGHQPELCFAATVTRDHDALQVNADSRNLSDDNLADLADVVEPLGEGFAMFCVDDEYFILARNEDDGLHLLLSDPSMAVTDHLAAAVLRILGEDVPDVDLQDLLELNRLEDEDLQDDADDDDDDDDDLSDLEVTPVGDLALLEDYGLPAERLAAICDQPDRWASEQLMCIAAAIGCGDALADAVSLELN